jgi:hypothetical protein
VGKKYLGSLYRYFERWVLKAIIEVGGLTSTKIAAEESLLQMIPNPAIQAIQAFNENPTAETLQALKTIPSLYRALRLEAWQVEGNPKFSAELLGTCLWLQQRAEIVLKSLIQHSADPPDGFVRAEDDWFKVIIYY